MANPVVAVDDAVITDEEQQRLYAGRFYRQTNKLPIGPVSTKIARAKGGDAVAGLEAQVEVKGADGTKVLKTIFTPIRHIHIERNKYRAADEDRKHRQEEI